MTCRVLVFGSSNAGKTSVLNALIGGDPYPTNDDVSGCTFRTTKRTVERDGRSFLFFDTAGLNETDSGTVPSGDAVKRLIKLIRKSDPGYNLLVHVVRNGTVTRAMQKNHQLFCETISGSEIPVLLVVTGCENHEPMSDYMATNEGGYRTHGIEFTRAVSGCFARGGRLESVFAPLREESTASVWDAIDAAASPEPINAVARAGGWVVVFRNAWNVLAAAVGWPFRWLNERIRDLLIENGLPAADAEAEAVRYR